MARSGGEKERKFEIEDNRTDSGIESIYISRDYVSLDNSEEKDKLGTEERLDSAYVSSSLTVESLGDLIEECIISDCENPTDCEYTEEEVNFLTTVTEDGDTYV